eukprot:GHVU01122254.1.p1 GENE.GHVU01122254.1~~GHVU01122254.1.p1  ORF type:complete len:148 (-),score=11.50 GHVU01122254.1:366-809(-)
MQSYEIVYRPCGTRHGGGASSAPTPNGDSHQQCGKGSKCGTHFIEEALMLRNARRNAAAVAAAETLQSQDRSPGSSGSHGRGVPTPTGSSGTDSLMCQKCKKLEDNYRSHALEKGRKVPESRGCYHVECAKVIGAPVSERVRVRERE